jgi:hypothetical protein
LNNVEVEVGFHIEIKIESLCEFTIHPQNILLLGVVHEDPKLGFPEKL